MKQLTRIEIRGLKSHRQLDLRVPKFLALENALAALGHIRRRENPRTWHAGDVPHPAWTSVSLDRYDATWHPEGDDSVEATCASSVTAHQLIEFLINQLALGQPVTLTTLTIHQHAGSVTHAQR